MKITKQLSLLLVVLLTAFSCDELDELTEFDITDDFSTTVTISADNASEGSFVNSATINLATNQQIQDNLDLIQNISLNSLTYEISNFIAGEGAEDAVITEASLTLGSTMISVSNINLKASDDNNTLYTVENSSLLNAIASALESNTAITASVSGTVDSTPVTFDVIINLDVTVTVDVL
ncbi:MAG: hypothetical protein NWP87_00245 [Winogradskyella sp.]|nr:hypothetical protein [Winogradskyella sp.]